LLILDEATSALDPENAAAVRAAIAALHGSMTIILIGHQMSIRDGADQVIVLDSGRII
jgi:ATP-binding cassette, subfamily C, bacterial